MQQRRSLAAKAVLVDGVAAIGGLRRLLHPREIVGKIGSVEWRAMLLQKGHHLACDVPLVEAVARSGDAGRSAAPLGAALGLDHACESSCEAGEADRVAGFVARAVGLVPVRLVSRPLVDEGRKLPDRAGSAQADRETLVRILDGSS